MKLYCLVTNNTVTEGPLPLSPTLSKLSDFELLDLGWYYAECIRPESFVDRTEVMNLQFDIQPRKVICTFVKRDKTQIELSAQNAEKQKQVEVRTAKLEAERIAALNANAGATKYMEATALVTIAEAVKEGKVSTIIVPYDFKGIVNVK